MKTPPSDATLARAFIILTAACHHAMKADPKVKALLLNGVTQQHHDAEFASGLMNRPLSNSFLDALCTTRDMLTDPTVAAATPTPDKESPR